MVQRSSNCSRISVVPSTDALSMTITSLFGYFCSRTDSRHLRMKRPLLYVTIVTDTQSVANISMSFLFYRGTALYLKAFSAQVCSLATQYPEQRRIPCTRSRRVLLSYIF